MILRRDGYDGANFIGTDINIKALECAKKVADLNNNKVTFIED
jgi:methylase of polypeptide subunit release factors